MELSKIERLLEFARRMIEAPRASSFEDAYALLRTTMDSVEDELTDIPNSPHLWETDGRLYPPQMDSVKLIGRRRQTRRFRARDHYVFIGANGAVLIRSISGRVLLNKPGLDGKHIQEEP